MVLIIIIQCLLLLFRTFMQMLVATGTRDQHMLPSAAEIDDGEYPLAAATAASSPMSPGSGDLNTPLGSLMPAEYAGVEITQLFPAYNPGKTPRWSSLFKLAHSITTYGEFMERADVTRQMLPEAVNGLDADDR